jgi:hypothetical protein
LKWGIPKPSQPIQEKSFHKWTLPGSDDWAVFYRLNEHYLVRLVNLADFILTEDGKNATVYPVPGVSDETIEHLYRNVITPLALSRQHKLVLHGSAVVVGDYAIAFIGESGRGKSTLAAEFVTSGYSFLTDDGLQIEATDDTFFVHPSHPSIRLWDDSRKALIPEGTGIAPQIDYTPKARLLADERIAFCKEARPLKSLYFLGDKNSETISITPVTGQRVIAHLAKNSFLLDMEEKEMLAHQFGQLTALAQHPIFFRLDYPRSYADLCEVRHEILKHVREGRVTQA